MPDPQSDVDEDDGPAVKPFAAFLQELSAGKIHAQAGVDLHKLIQAVTATGKPGSLVVTVTVKPIAKNNTDSLNIAAAVATKAPKEDPAVTVFFVDAGGNPTRNNPVQPEIPGVLREVPANTRPVREVRAAQ